MTGSAGRPPFRREVTITPRPVPCDDGPPVTTIRAVPEDGPPTVAYTPLDAADDHELRPTEELAAVLPVFAGTGRGSATDLPEPEPYLTRSQELRAVRASVATVRKYRRRRVARRVFLVVLVALCVAVTLAAGWFAFLSWEYSQDRTLVQLRVVSPLLSLVAVALLSSVLAMVLLMLAARR